jgi:hypothetical protein
MALSAGSIAFTGFNADGNDALAFVVLTDIKPGEQISFTLGVWSGAANSFGANAITVTWTAPASALVAAGTVIVLSTLDTTPSANIGTLTEARDMLGDPATFELDQISIVLAYEGPRNLSPTNFVTGISGSPFGWNYVGTGDGIAGTGLTDGVTAHHLGGGFNQIAAYTGPRVITGDVLADAARINLGYDPVSFEVYWQYETGSGTDTGESSNGVFPDLPFNTTSFHEPLLYVAADNARAAEGAGPDSLSFGFHLEVPLSVETVVTYQVTGAGTYAANASDFGGGVFPTGTVTIPAGETSAYVTFTPADDGAQEFNETFDVAIVGTYPGLLVQTAPARGAILDDDGTGTAPIAVDDHVSIAAGSSVIIDLLANDTDPNGDWIFLDYGFESPFSIPANGGSIGDLFDGTIRYTPAPGFTGSDTFTYTIRDANGETATATVTVNIGENTPPITVSDTAATDEDTAVTIDVLSNDSDAEDGTPLPGTVTAAYGASHGVVSINPNGTITYTPHLDYSGTDSFTYG